MKEEMNSEKPKPQLTLAGVRAKLSGMLSGAPRFSLQMLLVIVAAVVVAAGAMYFVNTVFLDTSALNDTKKVVSRQFDKNGTLIAAVVTPQQKIRDLFQYADAVSVAPHVVSGGASAPVVSLSQGSGSKASPLISGDTIPSYGGDVILKGIAKSGITKYALISYNGKTQLYRVGESFGPYSIANIADGSIALNSPSGLVRVQQRQLPSVAKKPQQLTGGGANDK